MTDPNHAAEIVRAWIAAVRAFLAGARKAVVAVAGVLASLLTAGLLPDPIAGYVATALAVLAAIGVYAAPNQARTTRRAP